MDFFNCDDPNHMISKCPKKIDVTRAAKRKMEYYDKKTGNKRNAHVVLFELCNQLDYPDDPDNKIVESEGEDDFDITDSNLFEALISHSDIPPELLIPETHMNRLILTLSMDRRTCISQPSLRIHSRELVRHRDRKICGWPGISKSILQIHGNPLSGQTRRSKCL